MDPALIAAALLSPCGAPPGGPTGAARDRPALSGPEQTRQTGRFLLHWTDQGDDAVPDATYVDRIEAALLRAEQTYLDRGWRPALDDGDGLIDVYVSDIPAFGFAWWAPTEAGTSCYVEIDPALRSLGDVGLESVVAHEWHHCVQYAYAPTAGSWLLESTSTFWQYLLYQDDTLQLGLDVLWNQRLRGADRPLRDTGDRFEYAGFVFMKYWAERGARDEDRLQALWQALADDPTFPVALDAEAARLWGTDLTEAWLRHLLWNRFACALDDGAHYDGSTHPCTLPAVQVELPEPVDATSLTVALPPGPFVAAYRQLARGDGRPPELRCDPPQVAVALSAVDASGREVDHAIGRPGEPVALSSTIPPGGTVTAVIASLGDLELEATCELARVEPVAPDPSDPEDPAPTGCGGGAAWLLLASGPRLLRRRRPSILRPEAR